jgi:uncharacterized repeat protein (TIGR01451 family)
MPGDLCAHLRKRRWAFFVNKEKWMFQGKDNKQHVKTTGARKEFRLTGLHNLNTFANPGKANILSKMFGSLGETMRCHLTYSVRMGLITMLLWLGCVSNASAAILNQPMTGASAPGWVIGGNAYLTASAGIDPVGAGWLRLTDPGNNEAGFGYYNSAFDISQGAVIQYDYATWGGSGADGYSIYLFDASFPFSVGASGGSLGYAQKTVAPVNPGLSGGYVGVGVDEFGNYSNPTEGRIGGIGLTPNAVAVRGPYNNSSGAYYYLGGSATLAPPLAFSGQEYRPIQTDSQYRKVVIYLTPVAAPNYLQIDVYVQFGYNQPLTAVATKLYTGQPIPASVMVGYAASTGGSTNYHEIRNLVVSSLPAQNVDLSIAKTVSSPSVAPGGTVTFTLAATNLGPASTTVANAQISDTVPSQITGVTWTCAGTGGATCGAASGSGNAISTTATLPFDGVATYTITGTVSPSTPIGTKITNTASITAPSGYTDYNTANNSSTATTEVTNGNVTISGTIFLDNGSGGGTAHNGIMDGSEAGITATTIGNTYYVKVYNSSDLSTLLSYATVSGGASTYALTVPAYGTYTVILSTDNAATFDPSLATSGDYTYTLPVNFTNTVTTSGSNVTGLNFGAWRGSRVVGRVINDNGAGGTSANANDGIQNGTEAGISGVSVKASSATGGTGSAYDTETTDANGNFTLFIPFSVASGNVYLYEALPAGYLAVNFNAGSTGGTYTTASNTIAFAYTQYTNYTNVIFSNVATNTFTPTPLGADCLQSSSVFYAHKLVPGSDGTVTFSDAQTRGTWTVTLYQDTTCSGTYQAGDPVITAAVNATTGVPICILVKNTVAASATTGQTDVITTSAAFSYTNSLGPVISTLSVSDTTTVEPPPVLTIVESASPSPTLNPGQVITYNVLVTNTAATAGVATTVLVTDSLCPYVSFGLNSYGTGVPFKLTNGAPSAGVSLGTPVYSMNNGATWTYTPVSGGGGAPAGYDMNVTNWQIPITGTMNANGANFTINYTAIAK